MTELRVHGVGGTQPQHMLDDPAPVKVAGDAISGFYRQPDADGRHIEAYSWGGMTSRSASRVLWLLLLPFLLANLAGWMVPAHLAKRPRAFTAYRAAMRLAALAVTLNAVLFLTWIPIDYIGYQCGARPDCTTAWLLQPFAAVQDRPGRRILLAALVPLIAIALQAFVTVRSVRRYERVKPPGLQGEQYEAEPACSAAALTTGLAHPDFWDGRRAVARLGAAHIAASLAMTAALVAFTVRTVVLDSGPLDLAALALSGLVLAAAVVALVVETERRWPDMLARWLLGAGLAALVLSAVFAWRGPRVTYVAGELPGMRAAMSVTYAVVALALLAVLITLVAYSPSGRARRSVLAAVVGGVLVLSLALWFVDGATIPYARPVTALVIAVAIGIVGAAARGSVKGFRWCAPFVVLFIAVLTLNTIMMGVLIRVADTLGEVHYDRTRYVGDAKGPVILVFQVVRSFLPYLVFVPLAILALFLCWQLVLYCRARYGAGWTTVRDFYLRQEGAAPLSFPDDVWTASTVSDRAIDDRSVPDRLHVRPWAHRVAGWRRLAKTALDLDLLLTSITAAGIFLAASLEIKVWLHDKEVVAGLQSWMVGIGTTLAATLPLALLALLRAGWSNPNRRRVIGVLWDVGTFWPRSYHPLAPPSYAERAVPELQRRIWWLHDNNGRVLITAHSQGSILAAAALAQPGRRDSRDLVSLVTLGSPLDKLYNWSFPAYFNSEALSALRVVEWRNLYYLTDYVGASVPADPVCANVQLPDPPTSRFRWGEPLPRVGSHTGYWNDPALWTNVGDAAKRLATVDHDPENTPPVPA